jgi:hypothetical protein
MTRNASYANTKALVARLNSLPSEFSVVSYAPIIESKPNDMSTVFTTMKRCADMTKAMCQVHSVQTFDQELYTIAKQVEWAIPETFLNHHLLHRDYTSGT